MLIVNLYRFRLSNEEKINIIIKQCQDRKVDCLIMSKVNTKWSSQNKEIIKRKLRLLNRNVEVIITNSSNHDLTEKTGLPEA